MKGPAAATINRELAIVKRMFRLAKQGGKYGGDIPHIPMQQEHKVRQRFFELEQLHGVLKHLPDPLRPVIEFAYITGWRVPSEVLTLTSGQVRVDGRLTPGQGLAGIVRLEGG